MKREYLIAIRNDQDQVLVLEAHAGATPVFPGGEVSDKGGFLKEVVRKVAAETGLLISGLHFVSVSKARPGHEMHRYTAYVTGGRMLMVSLPTAAQGALGFKSASWIAPSLIARLQGASPDMLELAASLAWMNLRPST